MAAWFVNHIPNYGFFDTQSPAEIWVPEGGVKYIFLRSTEDCTVAARTGAVTLTEMTLPGGKGVPPAVWNDILAAAAPQTPGPVGGLRVFKLDKATTTKGKGGDVIVVKNAKGTELTRLIAFVLERKTTKLAFYFVTDKAKRHTIRKPGDVDGWVKAMNAIYTPQVNRVFVKERAVPLPLLKEDLGSWVNLTARSGIKTWDIFRANAKDSADFKVFFVWELFTEAELKTPPDDTEATTDKVGGSMLALEDSIGSTDTGLLLAHEVGHLLGAKHDKVNKGTVMFEEVSDLGPRITYNQALSMM